MRYMLSGLRMVVFGAGVLGAIYGAGVSAAEAPRGVSTPRGEGDRTAERVTGPDLIVADLQDIIRWGRVGDITAFSVGATTCNMGDQPVKWVLNTNEHPVVPQHLYRYQGGRFEQIGLSWISHTFFALNQTFCSEECVPNGSSSLGVLCSDAHSANINGLQYNLAPRGLVNAATGYFPYPWVSSVPDPDIGRRLQVHDADLHPPDNPGAVYFVEVHYLAADETQAGNDDNNCAYRRVDVVWDAGDPTFYDLALAGGYSTVPESAALAAWQELDPGVTLQTVDIADDGRMILGYRVTALGGGSYHYEYALYNMNSHRSAQSFTVPVPAGVTVSNFGFHDVDYHSGDLFEGTDWPGVVTSNGAVWETTPYSSNINANAVRWGTTYNFRFDADAPPAPVDAAVTLFRPGTPSAITIPALGPVPLTGADCNSNGVDDALDIFAGTSQDCNRTAIPDECDTAGGTSLDCNTNSIPDECEVDCNTNGIPDDCDIQAATSGDCNLNGTPDECETDCNLNGRPDDCDIAGGTSSDCNLDTVPDECTLAAGGDTDCNTNGVLDQCDLTGGTSFDCNSNGVSDDCDLLAGTSVDCNANGTPDDCDLAGGTSADCNSNAVPDECESAADCNSNTFPDFCDLYVGTSLDCNVNSVPDECDIAGGTSVDCNANGTPDDCELADCNYNGIPDDCDLTGGTSQDLNGNTIPDECEGGIPTMSQWGAAVMGLLLLIAGTVVLQRRELAMAASGGGGVSGFGRGWAAFPLNGEVFRRVALVLSVLSLSVLGFAVVWGGPISPVDAAGTVACVFLGAYLLHLWIGGAKNRDGD